MNNQTGFSRIVIAMLLMLGIAFSPALAYAKSDKSENGKGSAKKELAQQKKQDRDDDDDDRDEKKIEKSERRSDDAPGKSSGKGKNASTSPSASSKKGGKYVSCSKAFGHLIALGWIKHNGVIEFSSDCVLPFGIWKKLHATSTPATSTPDTIAPVISGISASTSQYSAIISWTTNESATGKIYYSTSSPAVKGALGTLTASHGGYATGHAITLSGLSASTTYYAFVESKDASGNIATSSQISFTTSPVTIISDTEAPVISGTLATIGTSTAAMQWTTSEPATSRAYYSTSSPVVLASTTPSVYDATLVSSRSILISGLSTSTLYYVVLESKDASGNTATSSQISFTTASGI